MFSYKFSFHSTSCLLRYAFSSRHFCSATNQPMNYGILKPNQSLQLISGKILPSQSIRIPYASWGSPSNPTILIVPSMSNSCFVTNHSHLSTTNPPTIETEHGGLWWKTMVGFGSQFAIDCNKYHILSFTPLGSPYGSTSPLTINPITGKSFGPDFPTITPADQASFLRLALQSLAMDDNIYAVIGGSMGGMQVLEYCAQYPSTYEKMCVIASTGWTSPSTVALRSIQRRIVRLDPYFHKGYYSQSNSAMEGETVNADEQKKRLLIEGLLITRMVGTICYRSRLEFDERFDWNIQQANGERDDSLFEVEKYLLHQGQKFAGYYDANCYLTLSDCMDRMNLGFGFQTFEEGVIRIPYDKEIMLISYDTDQLTPAHELEKLAGILGSRNNSRVYYETLHSQFGHDTFLMDKDITQLEHRLRSFIDCGIQDVHRIRKELM